MAPVSDLPATIKAITEEPINVIFDIVVFDLTKEPETQVVAYESILAPGGRLVISPGPTLNESRLTPDKAVYVVLADPRIPSQYAIGTGLYRHLSTFLAAGELKVSIFGPLCQKALMKFVIAEQC